jgi:hypothetical protein
MSLPSLLKIWLSLSVRTLAFHVSKIVADLEVDEISCTQIVNNFLSSQQNKIAGLWCICLKWSCICCQTLPVAELLQSTTKMITCHPRIGTVRAVCCRGHAGGAFSACSAPPLRLTIGTVLPPFRKGYHPQRLRCLILAAVEKTFTEQIFF